MTPRGRAPRAHVSGSRRLLPHQAMKKHLSILTALVALVALSGTAKAWNEEVHLAAAGSNRTSLVADVVGRTAASVYMLGFEDPAQGFVPTGTGWVVAPGLLATNAHVAEALRGADDRRLFAKQSWSGTALPLDRASIQMHPTYVAWDAAFSQASIPGTEQGLVSPADLALVRVVGETGPPLTLGACTPDAMGPGDQVLYIGYPHESRAGRPTRQVVLGNITALSDVFFDIGAWEDTRLIHVSLPVCGGASGSPLLNLRGEVIGVMSASDHVHSAFSNRVPFGFGYAQRVDFLRELLDGLDESVIAARDAQWRAVLGVAVPEEVEFWGADGLTPAERLEGMSERAREMFEHQQRDVVDVQDQEFTTARATERTVVHLEAGAMVAVIAVEHHGQDIDLRAFGAGEVLLAEDIELDSFPVLVIGPFDVAQDVTILLHCPSYFGTTCAASMRTLRSAPREGQTAGLVGERDCVPADRVALRGDGVRLGEAEVEMALLTCVHPLLSTIRGWALVCEVLGAAETIER
jgi:S1-C subfamily serine protease